MQTLVEANLEAIFGVRFLASEYSTGKVHRGRIDSLGLDENGSPVILEYKRTSNENVINQGLFYLDWLMDHQGEFQILVDRRLGRDEAAKIDWSAPRLICIANDFTRYDEHAVRQIDRNVELVRYRDFGSELLAIELVTTTTTTMPSAAPGRSTATATQVPGRQGRDRTVADLLAQADEELQALYEAFEAYALSLGDDVVKNGRKNYFAFRRLKNFACRSPSTVPQPPRLPEARPRHRRDAGRVHSRRLRNWALRHRRRGAAGQGQDGMGDPRGPHPPRLRGKLTGATALWQPRKVCPAGSRSCAPDPRRRWTKPGKSCNSASGTSTRGMPKSLITVACMQLSPVPSKDPLLGCG